MGLALELADQSPLDATARARLAAGAPLVDNSLVLIEDTDRPFLTRGIRVPDRVTAHLLGDDNPDPALTGVLTEPRGHRNRSRSNWRMRSRPGSRSAMSARWWAVRASRWPPMRCGRRVVPCYVATQSDWLAVGDGPAPSRCWA